MIVRRILILGTDPSAVELLHGLVRCGLDDVELDMTTSVQEAIEWIGRRSYHVVMCNRVLTGMSGMEFALRTSDLRPRPAVVMLTAEERDTEWSSQRDETIFATVRTPLCFRTLRAVLDHALELTCLQRQAARFRTIRSCLKGGDAYAASLQACIIETEARMTNLRAQRRPDLVGDLPGATGHEATLDDLCFGWAAETNLMYTPPSRRHKEVA